MNSFQVNKPSQLGGARQLYIIGSGRAITQTGGVYAISSDLTAAGTSQVITLDVLNPYDMVLPACIIDVVTPFVLAAGTLTAKLGITGTDDLFVAATSVKSTTVKVLTATVAAAALPYVNNTASPVNMLLTLTAGAGNVADATGEMWVWVPVIRYLNRVQERAL
jgi:hypothetical protein